MQISSEYLTQFWVKTKFYIEIKIKTKQNTFEHNFISYF